MQTGTSRLVGLVMTRGSFPLMAFAFLCEIDQSFANNKQGRAGKVGRKWKRTAIVLVKDNSVSLLEKYSRISRQC